MPLSVRARFRSVRLALPSPVPPPWPTPWRRPRVVTFFLIEVWLCVVLLSVRESERAEARATIERAYGGRAAIDGLWRDRGGGSR